MKHDYVYIEIKSFATQKVEFRTNVTGKKLEQIELIENALNQDLDSDYYTIVKAYPTPQKEIDAL